MSNRHSQPVVLRDDPPPHRADVALARTTTEPQLGDAARLISALDHILELGAAYIDIWERDFPCAPQTLRTWAACHGFEVETLPSVLRVANAGRVHICLHRAVKS